MDMTQIYLQRLEIACGLIANVKTDQLGDPTPCADFDVRSLINHFLGDSTGLAKAAKGETVDQSKLIGVSDDHIAAAGEDLQAAARALLDEARGAWSRPSATEGVLKIGDGMPAQMGLRIALIEAVVHGWDIATATQQSYSIPDELAAPMLDGMTKVMGTGERPEGGFFGPAVELPGTASAADRLLAFTGRTP